MLTHSVIGPYEDGMHLVVYPTPGCSAFTVARVCRSEGQAEAEAERLNLDQIQQEEEIRRERELRGLHGFYPDLQEQK
jgi:hypothetical protein